MTEEAETEAGGKPSALGESIEELADTRAVDDAWAETKRLGEMPVPWEEAKRDLGLE